jgi:hypothetical protein
VTALAGIQHAMQRHLMQGDTAVAAHVVGTARVPVETRLGIYSNAYRTRLIEALAHNYPALAKLLGEEAFAQLGAAYFDAHPSRFASIRWYGDALPEFIAREGGAADAPLLVDLAHFEWAMAAAFDAADAEPIDASALGGVAAEEWGGLRFAFHPAMRMLALAWNAPQIWQAVTGSQCGAEISRPAAALSPEPIVWLLWRQDLRTMFRSLAPLEARVLDLARRRASFAELCEQAADSLGEEAAPLEVATMLRGWIDAGLVVGLTLAPD